MAGWDTAPNAVLDFDFVLNGISFANSLHFKWIGAKHSYLKEKILFSV
jgi:hypothetical protein